MSTYLVVKYNNSNISYTAKDNMPNKPYINISNKYFPLTTETSGTGIKVKINNNIYKIIESYTTTINTTYKSDYTYKNTYTQSWKIGYLATHGIGGDQVISMTIGMQPNNFRVNRTVNFSITRVRSTKYTFSTRTTSNSKSLVVSGASTILTNHYPYKEITNGNLYTNEGIQLSVQGTTNDSATYVSFSSSARATNRSVEFPMHPGLNNNKYDTIASTVNSTRQGNTTTTTTSQ